MIEILTMFLTSGGSAMLGSVLKGVFGAITDSRQNKYELELARECRNNAQALEFQKQINSGEGGLFTRVTRRLLAVIIMSTLSAVIILSILFPEATIIAPQNIGGEGNIEIFFGLITFPKEQATLEITTGALAYYFVVVLAPMVTGFYFTPSGKR
jgi:hypothetical protein